MLNSLFGFQNLDAITLSLELLVFLISQPLVLPQRQIFRGLILNKLALAQFFFAVLVFFDNLR